MDEIPQLVDTDRDAYDRRKVPLTLLTGYLGAGKSTLLEYILTADHGYKIAVCMNDFGDTTDIESKALTLTDPVTGEQKSEMLSLPNGCLCCSFKDMGIAAVEEMAHAQGVEWVIVELTGLADPAKGFWENEEMGDLVLDGVVCVVDSRNVLKQLDGGEAQRQIACADVILLNKTDLVEEATLVEVERAVKRINSTIRMHRTERSRMPLDELFGIRSYSGGGGRDALVHDLDHDHGHDAEIKSVLVPLPLLTVRQFHRLNDFLEQVLWAGKIPPDTLAVDAGVEVLRTKGLIARDDGTEHILQGVTDLYEFTEVPGWGEAGKVVFIGRRVEIVAEALTRYL